MKTTKLRCPKCGCWSNSSQFENGERAKKRPKPVPHNPDGLTPEQVGRGWRLLDVDEIKNGRRGTKKIHAWWPDGKWHKPVYGYVGNLHDITYRTRLTRAELRRLK